MGRYWEWPNYDKKLLQVFDWVKDCQKAIDLCEKHNLVIQAGGATGVWPAYLAGYFDNVIAVEPETDNYRCMEYNLEGMSNVSCIHAALSNEAGHCSLNNDATEAENCGTWYVVDGKDIRLITIDSLNVNACDLICLDVEGHERKAREGGIKTIERFKPVIMLESKSLPYLNNDPEEAERWLARIGYKRSAQVHRDIILTCG